MELTVRNKMLGLAALEAILTLAVGISGNWGMRDISQTTEAMFRNEAKLAEHASAAQVQELELRRWEKNMFLRIEDPKQVEDSEKSWRSHHEGLVTHLQTLRQLVHTSKDQERVAQMAKDCETYISGMSDIFRRIKAGEITSPQAGDKAILPFREEARRLDAVSEELAVDANARMLEVQVALNRKTQRTLWTMVIFALVAVAAGVVLAQAISRTVEELARIIREARAASNGLSSAAAQVSSSSQTLSEGTNEQAASVEETTASLEEMSASISQNAENSRQMEQMALKGADDAEGSGVAVKETLEAMKAIAEKISIVEDIAYQTNLLALNAAIEAARAGEHGKGFAVVATEVRKLAERSQRAAKEISGLAGSSVKIAERAGQSLVELVPAIKKTAELVQEVAAASREQSAGVSQISKAMSQVDQVTQRNAAAAEQLSSTAEGMANEAEALQQLMAFYRVASGAEKGEKQQAGILRVSRIPEPSRQALHPTHTLAPAGGNGRVLAAAVQGDRDFTQF